MISFSGNSTTILYDLYELKTTLGTFRGRQDTNCIFQVNHTRIMHVALKHNTIIYLLALYFSPCKVVAVSLKHLHFKFLYCSN